MMIGSNSTITLAYNSLTATNNAIEKTARALSTGLRTATAADDAAGFAMAQKMSAQIAGLNRAIRNTQDGVSMLQTAEGAMNQINSMLQRMRELSLQAANDTLTTQDRNYIQLEIDELKGNIDNIAKNTTFNNKRLLDGSSAATWSADNLKTRVNITGAITSIDQFGQKTSIEGNYRIEVRANPGKAQVQKTAIFTIPDTSDADTEDYSQEINITDGTGSDGKTSGTGWKFEDGVLTITGNGNYSITGDGSDSANKIIVNQGINAKIRLTDVNINSSDGPALQINNSNVDLKLRGTNNLTSTDSNSSGIELNGDVSSITINSTEGSGSEEGSLTVSGIKGTDEQIKVRGGTVTSTDPQMPIKMEDVKEKIITLKDIPEFYNSEGVFLLTDPQEITITQGDGKKASVMLYSTDTIEDVRQKLNDAIANDIGQADYTDNADNFVRFVESGKEDSSGFESVAGTFVIRSAVPGSMGRLTFSSDNQDLISAFNLNTIQEATESTYRASVYNAHTGKAIAKNIITDGNYINGVIAQNVNVEFDAMANIRASWNAETKNYILAENSQPFETTIHIVDRSTAFQIGQNDGEDMYVNIADMSSSALGLDRVNLTTRQSASESIGIIDAAIHQVSRQRSRIGAYQNELEYNANSLTQTHLHMQEAESRLTDADMATEYMEFVKLQILNNTGSSMLSQANQNAQSLMSILSA